MTAVIYSLCDNRRTVSHITRELCELYPDAGEEIKQDVPMVIRDLESYKVIRLRDNDVNPDIPQASKPHEHHKLCIGMATFDDYDGVYFSIQAIRMYHPEMRDLVEFVVVDNNPGGACSKALKQLETVGHYRYIPNNQVTGTAVRNHVFQQANSDYVLCMDSHVLIAPGAIAKLVDYMDQRPECRDLLQGPLLYDQLSSISTHFKPKWRSGMYGTWGQDERGEDPEGEPFDVPMQGLGLFACRKDAWLGFNPRFSGFGGEEGYIHEKFRQAGGRTLCLPFLRWLHRFSRPMGTRYEVKWADRIRNYLIGHHELGLDSEPVKTHFREHVGEQATAPIFAEVEREIASPFHFFDAIYCINMTEDLDRWRKMEVRFELLGIADRVQRFEAIVTPPNHHAGCTLSHREIIRLASDRNLENVLVFEDDARFLDEPLDALASSLDELRTIEWKLFYLGACLRIERDRALNGFDQLRAATLVTCTHAIAYHRRSYSQILEQIPAVAEEFDLWLEKEKAIDQYLTRNLDSAYLATPTVSVQAQTLQWEPEELKDRFR